MMMMNRCTMTGTTNKSYRSSTFARTTPIYPFPSRLTPRASFPRFGKLYGPECKFKLCSPREHVSLRFLAASTSPFSKNENGAFPWLPTRKSKITPLTASKDTSSNFHFPPMEKKPKFWWRVLACTPYLMPLHTACKYADSACNLHPFFDEFEGVIWPFVVAIFRRLPIWFWMIYFSLGYLFIARRKEWPHFFRFHFILGSLLGMALEVLGIGNDRLPRSYVYGKIGMHFWVAIAFAHLFTVLECIRCALCGMYADVPFASDACYIHSSPDY